MDQDAPSNCVAICLILSDEPIMSPLAVLAEPISSAARRPLMPSPALLTQFDRFGPRYTSYPTADRFVEAADAEQWGAHVADRAGGSMAHAGERPLSLYVHVPFCESLCYYCACNKIVTHNRERAATYLNDLDAEVATYQRLFERPPPVGALHLGGGTPTFFNDEQLAQLLAGLRKTFAFDARLDASIEVDPRTIDRQRLQALRQMGFTRVSFGVQDLDPRVQQAVHRVQGEDEIAATVADARALGFTSINVDLIYGLPMQTPERFARTLAVVAGWKVDRLALYAYAHMPTRFKPQRRIEATQLPSAEQRVTMLGDAIRILTGAGYEYIGMDHFALPTDSLARARRQGTLARDFQGYSVGPELDTLGLGVSSISRIGPMYSQNQRDWAAYRADLEQGRLPVMRGLVMTRDDLIRRAVIMALMCHGEVSIESIELAHLIRFSSYFAHELRELDEFERLDLLVREDGYLRVTEIGWYFVRAIAMVFDHYARQSQMLPRARLI